MSPIKGLSILILIGAVAFGCARYQKIQVIEGDFDRPYKVIGSLEVKEKAINRLPRETQVQVVNALCQGMSLRAITRLLGVHRTTVMRILERTGPIARLCAASTCAIWIGGNPS